MMGEVTWVVFGLISLTTWDFCLWYKRKSWGLVSLCSRIIES